MSTPACASQFVLLLAIVHQLPAAEWPPSKPPLDRKTMRIRRQAAGTFARRHLAVVLVNSAPPRAGPSSSVGWAREWGLTCGQTTPGRPPRTDRSVVGCSRPSGLPLKGGIFN